MQKNTQNKRNFFGSISVKIDSIRNSFELASASDYGGDENLIRVRKNRRWLDGFFSKEALLNVIREDFIGGLKPKPDLRYRDAVRVYYPHDGIEYHKTFIGAPPIMNFEGNWVCPILITGKGYVYVDCDNIELIRRSAYYN